MTTQKNTPTNSPGKDLGAEKNAGTNNLNNPKEPIPGQEYEDREENDNVEEKAYRQHEKETEKGIDSKDRKTALHDTREPEVDPQRINTPYDPNKKVEENPGKQRERERNPEKEK